MRSRWLTGFDRLLRRTRPAPDGSFVLGSRQVYILPTTWGGLFGVLLVALLFAAINYGNNLVFALTFLLAGIGHAGLLLTWRNLAGLRLTVRNAEPVFAGDTAAVPVVASGAMRRPREDIQFRFSDQPEASLSVRPDRTNGLEIPLRTRTRGMLRPGRLTVSSRYPLALFRAWSLLETDSAVLVYPAPVRGYPLPEGTGHDSARRRTTGAGEEDFAGIRAYRPGDSLHRISWKATARTGQLHSKDFDRETGGIRWLDWQDVPAEGVEQRLGILTDWVLRVAASGETWGMRLPGLQLNPASGTVHRDRCLAALADYGLNP